MVASLEWATKDYFICFCSNKNEKKLKNVQSKILILNILKMGQKAYIKKRFRISK
jgi:hypothetical protein